MEGFRIGPWVLLLLVTSFLLAPAPASAQGAAGIAEARFREGTTHYDARRYEEARVAFLQAHALDAKPGYLLHLAHAELRVGAAADAANHLAQFLRENPSGPEGDRQEADIDLSAARARVTEVTLSARAGATLFVDEQAIGKAPLDAPYFVTPGERTFKASYMGEVSERKQSAAPGGSLTIDFGGAAPVGEVAAPPPPPEEGGDDDAAFAMDESGTSTPSGRRKPVVQWFLETPPAWVGAGLAGVGLVLGTTFAVTSGTHFDRANEIADELRVNAGQGACTNPTGAVANLCRDFDDSRSTGETQRTLAIVGFAVGGAAVAGTIIYYFVDPKARVSSDAALSVLPGASGADAGLSLVGRF